MQVYSQCPDCHLMTLRSVNGTTLCANCGYDPISDTTRTTRTLWWLVGVTVAVLLVVAMFALAPA